MVVEIEWPVRLHVWKVLGRMDDVRKPLQRVYHSECRGNGEDGRQNGES